MVTNDKPSYLMSNGMQVMVNLSPEAGFEQPPVIGSPYKSSESVKREEFKAKPVYIN